MNTTTAIIINNNYNNLYFYYCFIVTIYSFPKHDKSQNAQKFQLKNTQKENKILNVKGISLNLINSNTFLYPLSYCILNFLIFH